MTIAIVANKSQTSEILSFKKVPQGVRMEIIEKPQESDLNKFDGVFILDTDYKYIAEAVSPTIPVIINSVTITLRESGLPSNFSRLNAWNGFLSRTVYEVASSDFPLARKIFDNLQWDIIQVKDEPGLVAARVVCMIINEAYFALEDELSSAKEIDSAMKFGTNYPLGPFEWAEKIGHVNVYSLLRKLSAIDSRYEVSPLLLKQIPVSER